MVLPLTSQQCFFITILAFIVMGFTRGWRREVMTLVFVLLAVVLIHPDTSDALNGFLSRLGNFISYLSGSGGQLNAPPSSPGISFLAVHSGHWSFLCLLFFWVSMLAAGSFPHRILPMNASSGLSRRLSLARLLFFYLSSYAKSNGGSANLQVQVAPPDPSTFVPVIFVLALIALVIGLIASRFKKASGKK